MWISSPQQTPQPTTPEQFHSQQTALPPTAHPNERVAPPGRRGASSTWRDSKTIPLTTLAKPDADKKTKPVTKAALEKAQAKLAEKSGIEVEIVDPI
jgi:hypothetical protein